MDISLENKHALVCGSTQGIGLAVAKELASLGATCILLARNEQKLQAVIGEDFSDPEAVRLVAERMKSGGPELPLITYCRVQPEWGKFTCGWKQNPKYLTKRGAIKAPLVFPRLLPL